MAEAPAAEEPVADEPVAEEPAAPDEPEAEAPAGPSPRRGARRQRVPPSRRAIPFVGLTGGLGAGKSTALAALERLGAATLSTDAVVHELYATDEVRDAVVARWGDDVAPGRHRRPRRGRAGRVRRRPRSARGSRACCGRGSARAWRLARGGRPRRAGPAAAVVETPLLFEAGMEGVYDATIAVVADEDVRA